MKKILVIGATSTIAQHCIRIYAERGDKLFLVARNKKNLKKIAKNLKKITTSTIKIFSLDLRKIDHHVLMLNAAEKYLGEIDIVLIAHGTLPNQKLCEQNVKMSLEEIKNNALSTISLLTHLANRFEVKKKGSIAVISSVAGDRGRASNYVYGSAKAMINTFLSGMRQRLYKSNINILTIKPGLVNTTMTKNLKKNIFYAKPITIANQIVSAIDKNKNLIYTPLYWCVIMYLIKKIPEILFRKLRL
jgi:decaprenylphospho-beta-D-erythro-pentofuranosid-2-ulose 2-reductase